MRSLADRLRSTRATVAFASVHLPVRVAKRTVKVCALIVGDDDGGSGRVELRDLLVLVVEGVSV